MAAWRLTALCCLLLTPAATQEGPLRNLRVDPRTRRLTWDVAVAGGDGAPGVADVLCTKDGYPERAKLLSYCQFPTLDPCRVSNFTVSYDVIARGAPRRRVTAWVQYPDAADARARAPWAPANVTCRVRGGDELACAWAPGAADRGDARYRMTWTDAAREGVAAPRECPRYVAGGCRVGGAGRLPGALAVTVTASRRGRDVACTRLAFTVATVEEPGPPRVQVRCNASLAVLTWALTSLFHRRLRYELRLRKLTVQGGGAWVTETVTEDDWDPHGTSPGENRTNVFAVRNPGTLTVRVRAGQPHRDVFGAWSEPQTHACGGPLEDGEPRPWLTAALAAAGTALVLTGAALACRRWSLLDRAFPPIPRVRVPAVDAGPTDGAWVSEQPCEERCPTSRVSFLAEEEEEEEEEDDAAP